MLDIVHKKIFCNYSGSKFQGSPWPRPGFSLRGILRLLSRQGGRFKPALVRRNVRFNTVLLGATPKDSMKRTAKSGLGQGLESDED